MQPDAKAALAAIADPAPVIFANPGWRPGAAGALAARYQAEADRVAAVLQAAPGYAPTPCHRLPQLAEALGCRSLLLKDEGPRFGLGSFKSAGAAYAMIRQLERMLGEPVDAERAFRGGYRDRVRDFVFTTATSGNHGRGLAWASQLVGARCVIFAPSECSEGRIAAMQRRGAEIVRTGVNYDPAMRRCREAAASNGWTVFADTSWEGYSEIPTDIMLGYGQIVRELARQVEDWSAITHLVIQGGVGAFAGGLIAGLGAVDPAARITVMVVEPRGIAALQESARRGRPSAVRIEAMSLMTGISNAEISLAAWPTISERVRFFIGLRDEGVAPCMRFLASGGLDGVPIELGETGTAGLAAWISCMTPAGRAAIAAEGEVGALVLGCEGVTDRAIFERLIAQG